MHQSFVHSVRRPLLALGAVAMLVIPLAGCMRSDTGSAHRETVYERVIRTGTIRASYANYPPYCIKDANTGKLSGIFVDVLEEVSQRLKLKIDWVEEVGFGTIFEGLNSNREDIFGAGVWRNSTRGKVGDFSDPLFFNVINVYGRSDESRFSSLSQLDDPAVKVATQDGAIDDIIAKSDFPKANRVSVPQLNPWSDVLLNITTRKADLTFAEPAVINLYEEKNPGTLKQLIAGKPVRVFANTYALKMDEPSFKAMINSALAEIAADGTLEKILARYEKHPGEFYRLAPPYVLPSETTSTH